MTESVLRSPQEVIKGGDNAPVAAAGSARWARALGNRLDILPGVTYDAYKFVTFSHLQEAARGCGSMFEGVGHAGEHGGWNVG